MLYFASVEYLWLLLLVPLFPVLYALSLRARRKRVEKLGDPALVGRLMPSYSRARGWWKVSLFSIGFAFFVVGLSRPLIGAKLKEHEAKGVEVVIALDVSNSMLAQDYSPNRLERAKLAISRIVDKLRDDRIGLIVFAGSSYVQLPITTDYVSAKMFLGTISTESVPIQGTALADAINTAARSFSAQSEKSRAIIVITDGENHEDDPVKAAKAAAEAGIRVYTIGVGSPEGKPIPLKEGGLMKDRNGEIVVTHLDEDILREVASAGNGAYVKAGNTEFGLNPIIDSIKQMDEEKFSSVVFEEYDEQYMYFFAIALLFFVLEGLIGSRKTKLRLFGNGGEKAAMVLLLLAVSFSSFAQTDRRDVRRGNRDYRKENWKEAEIDYRKALVKDSLSTAANYNLAADLYRQGDNDGALSAMKKVEQQAVESGHGADYYYNLGDIALAKKDYKTAVDAFQKSLLERPEDLDAKENYIYARKMLENQQQNGGGGGSDNQDQNKDQNQDQNKDQNNQDQNKDNQNQDQNKDNQNNQDQNKDQNKDNQNNQDQNQDNQNQDQNGGQQPQDGGQPQEQKISPQAAQQMLQAIQAKEKETQDKVNKEKAAALKSKQKEKNW